MTSRFREAIRSTLRRISEYPRLYPLVQPTVRRAVLHQFPYSIYYRLEEDRVLALAALHQARSVDRLEGHILRRAPTITSQRVDAVERPIFLPRGGVYVET